MKGNVTMSKAIDIQNLSVILDNREVLSGITLGLEEGTFLGIVGPNGSGKTTLLKIMLGLLKPSQGSVLVFGMSPKEAVKKGAFGYLPQYLDVDAGFPATALDVVLMGLQGRSGPFRHLSGEDRGKAREMLATMGVSGFEGHQYGALSGGQQQRVSIARALVSNPKVLILDEPSTGIDVVGQEDFYHLLKGLQKRFNLTIVMVSHDVGAITVYVDEIACLNRTLHFQGNPRGALNDEVLNNLYGKSMDILMHTHLCDKCERLNPGA